MIKHAQRFSKYTWELSTQLIQRFLLYICKFLLPKTEIIGVDGKRPIMGRPRVMHRFSIS